MIYFDNSATTQLCAEAVNKMKEAMECYGNPSSLHSVGYRASEILAEARSSVESSLGIRRGSGWKLIFTGSGTEANNLAIMGSVDAKERRTSNRIITTDSEHPSVSEPLARLEKSGFEIIKLSTRNGIINMEEYRAALEKGAFMVSIMMVNNETGAYYDVANIFALARRICPDAILHCDATQGYMKVNFNLMRLGADMVTVSAHKIHGPKGVGVLCVAPNIIKQKKIVPIIRGGGQEDGFRSGTENMIGIAGFGGAAAEMSIGRAEKIAHITALRDYTEKLLEAIHEIRINRPAGARAPHIINLTLPSIKSETMVHFLSAKGISVSGGSACSSHNEKASAALLGFGISQKDAVCSLRISLCDTNTEAESDALAEALEEGVKTLVRVK